MAKGKRKQVKDAQNRNLRTTTRTIRRIVTINLDNSSGQDTYNKFSIADALSLYQSSNGLDTFYEQYQIENTKIWAYASGYGNPTVGGNAQVGTLLDMCTTKFYTCIDYDTNNILSEEEILSRASFVPKSLTKGYTLLADYRPRMAIGTGEQRFTTSPGVLWFNLESLTQPVFLGLKLFSKNYGGLRYHSTTGNMQEVKLLVETRIKLRGEKMG